MRSVDKDKQGKELIPVVTIVERKTVTTSLNVAEVFGKRHKNVIQAIENLGVSEAFARPNFQPSEYTDPTGRKLPMFNLTRDGFTMLVMGFTGEKAMKFKEAYIDAFNKMEKRIYQRVTPPQDAQWIEARSLGKVLRVQETSVIQKFVDYATAQGSKNAKKYYMAISKMENAALFFLEQKFTNLRDVLDLNQLMTVASADRIVSKALADGMKAEMNYKDIYVMAKENVVSFADMTGKTFIPAEQLRIAAPQAALAI